MSRANSSLAAVLASPRSVYFLTYAVMTAYRSSDARACIKAGLGLHVGRVSARRQIRDRSVAGRSASVSEPADHWDRIKSVPLGRPPLDVTPLRRPRPMF
jgi:hypothetical protein